MVVHFYHNYLAEWLDLRTCVKSERLGSVKKGKSAGNCILDDSKARASACHAHACMKPRLCVHGRVHLVPACTCVGSCPQVHTHTHAHLYAHAHARAYGKYGYIHT
eukprot:6189848-Pleurochrysis_carterae.AAC.2